MGVLGFIPYAFALFVGTVIAVLYGCAALVTLNAMLRILFLQRLLKQFYNNDIITGMFAVIVGASSMFIGYYVCQPTMFFSFYFFRWLVEVVLL
jgi:hypothetical protein